MKFSLIIVSHKSVAKAMYESLCSLTHLYVDVNYFCFDEDSDIEKLEKEISELIKYRKSINEEVVVVSDMKLGTPFNTIIRICEKYKIYHVTGMNLTLLLNINNMSPKYDDIKKLINDSICEAQKDIFEMDK